MSRTKDIHTEANYLVKQTQGDLASGRRKALVKTITVDCDAAVEEVLVADSEDSPVSKVVDEEGGNMKDIGQLLGEGQTDIISHPGGIGDSVSSVLNNLGNNIGKVLVLPVNPPQPTMTAVLGEQVSGSLIVKQEPGIVEKNVTISHQGSQQFINVYPQQHFQVSAAISTTSSNITIPASASPVKQENVLPSIHDFSHNILANKSSLSAPPTVVKREVEDTPNCGISKDIKHIVSFLKEEPKQVASPQHTHTVTTTAGNFTSAFSTFPKKEVTTSSLYGVHIRPTVSQIPTPAPIPSISTVLQQSTKNIAVGTQGTSVDIKPVVTNLTANVQKVSVCPEDIKDINTIIEEDIKSTSKSPESQRRNPAPVSQPSTVRIPVIDGDHHQSDSEDTIIDIGMPNEDIMDIPMSPKGDIMDIVMSPKGDIMDTNKHVDPVASAVASAGIIDLGALPDNDIIDIAMSPKMEDIIDLASSPDDDIIDIAMSSEDDNIMLPAMKKRKLSTIAESDVFDISDDSNRSDHLEEEEDLKAKLKKKCINRNKQILPEGSATKLHPYTCTRCGNGFAKRDLLVRHLPCNINVTERPFSCSNCGRGFTKKELLVKHLPCRANDKYCCTICGNGFAWKKLLQKHALTCEKEFFSKQETDMLFNINDDSNCKVYIKDTHPTQPFVCQICGKRSNRRYNIKKHVLTHKPDIEKFSELYIRDGIGSKPYQCKMCGHRSTSATLIQQHVLIMHYKKNNEDDNSNAPKDGSKFTCKNCEAVFGDKCCLMDHMHRNHNPNNLQPAQAFNHDNNAAKPYRCIICGYDFVTKSAILNHAACLHNKPAPAILEDPEEEEIVDLEESICKPQIQAQPQPQPLLQPQPLPQVTQQVTQQITMPVQAVVAQPQPHIPAPTPNEELTNSLFQCKVCERYFPTKQGVQQHVLSHVKHTCDICGSEFKWKNALKKHMEEHVANPTSSFVQATKAPIHSMSVPVSTSVQSVQQYQPVQNIQTVQQTVQQTIQQTVQTAQPITSSSGPQQQTEIPVLTNKPLLCQTPNANVIVQQVPQMSQASNITLQNTQTGTAMVTVQYMPQQAQGGGSIFTIQHVPQQQQQAQPVQADSSTITETKVIKQENGEEAVTTGIKQEGGIAAPLSTTIPHDIPVSITGTTPVKQETITGQQNPVTFTIKQKDGETPGAKQEFVIPHPTGANIIPQISIQINSDQSVDKNMDKNSANAQYMQIPSDFEPKEGGLYVNDSHEKQPYLCKSCGYRSSRRYNIRRHVWSKHTSPSYKTKFAAT